MKITEEMVMELNTVLANKGCIFRYEYYEPEYNLNNPHIRLTLNNMKFVDSFIINPTKEFFEWLYSWFETKGIELSCNNDGSVMWSRNGWS